MRGEIMDKIGEYFKEVRLTRGLTYSDVELATRIPQRYLEALEEGNYDRIPGKAYVIGFIRSYAKFLQVDSDELVSYYKEINGIEEEHPLPKPGGTHINDKEALAKANYHPMQRWKFGIIISFLVIVSLSGVLYYLGAMGDDNNLINDEQDNINNNDNNNNNDQPVVIPPDSEVTETPDDTEEPETPEQPEGLTILVSAKRGPCWIAVTNSTGYEEHYLNRGDQLTLYDQSYIKIKYGSSGAVDVYVNDVLQDTLGSLGTVITKEYNSEQENNGAIE